MFLFPFCSAPIIKDCVTKYFTSSDSTDISVCVSAPWSSTPKNKTHVRTICTARAWNTRMTAAEVTRSGPITRFALDKNRSARNAQPGIFKVIAYYSMAFAVSRSERCCLSFLFFRSANKMPTFFLWFITFFRCSCFCHCCFGIGPKERLTHIMHMLVCMAICVDAVIYLEIRCILSTNRIAFCSLTHPLTPDLYRTLLQTHLLAKNGIYLQNRTRRFFSPITRRSRESYILHVRSNTTHDKKDIEGTYW